MQDQKNMKGAYELTKLCKLIRHIYMPMEKGNQNIRTMLQNYSNTLKESVDQVTKSRDIKIPDFIEPNESKALSTNSTIEEYRSYLVIYHFFYFCGEIIFFLNKFRDLFLKDIFTRLFFLVKFIFHLFKIIVLFSKKNNFFEFNFNFFFRKNGVW